MQAYARKLHEQLMLLSLHHIVHTWHASEDHTTYIRTYIHRTTLQYNTVNTWGDSNAHPWVGTARESHSTQRDQAVALHGKYGNTLPSQVPESLLTCRS